jgi:predicted pyridoxine 5'-phosphate oxidase superfamily flavin-nucleotide-binding protein
MAKLTQEMKDLVAAQQCFIATVNPDGTPNVAPKRSTRVLDDEHLVFNEVTGKRTWENVKNGSKVAIAVVDREKMKGFRFEGTPEAVTSGLLYDQAGEVMKKAGMPAPKAVIKVKIEKIFNLGLPGSGEEII